MEFKITDLVVPDWRAAAGAPALPDRPMSEQGWELLEGFADQDEIGAMMQGIRQVDRAMTADAIIDADEWSAISAALRQGLERRGDRFAAGDRLTSAFAQQIADTIARRKGG